MGDATVSRTGEVRSTPTIEAIDTLWMTAGLGCDGDTIAMTAATQPSIEDIVRGALPWIPKVKLYNPFLAYENGDELLRPFRAVAGAAHYGLSRGHDQGKRRRAPRPSTRYGGHVQIPDCPNNQELRGRHEPDQRRN